MILNFSGPFVKRQLASFSHHAHSLLRRGPLSTAMHVRSTSSTGLIKHGDSRQTIKALTDANTLLDTWIGRFELARAYLEAGLFLEADSELERCVKRRGEAFELFLDNVPTNGYFPLVYYYQGRVCEGLKSPGYAESYRNYLRIRGQAGEDPLTPEIRRRLGR